MTSDPATNHLVFNSGVELNSTYDASNPVDVGLVW